MLTGKSDLVGVLSHPRLASLLYLSDTDAMSPCPDCVANRHRF
jgi:hypothetical protein